MNLYDTDPQIQSAFAELEGRLDFTEMLLLNAIQQLPEEGKKVLQVKRHAIFRELGSRFPADSKVPYHRSYLSAVANTSGKILILTDTP